MAYPVFSPPFPPLEPIEDGLQPRFITAQFGDGYAQNTLDGLNPEQSVVQFTFEPLSPSQALSLDAFFAANEGNPIAYALPTDDVIRTWTCTGRRLTRSSTCYSFMVQLTQVFLEGGGYNQNYSQATNSLYFVAL